MIPNGSGIRIKLNVENIYSVYMVYAYKCTILRIEHHSL